MTTATFTAYRCRSRQARSLFLDPARDFPEALERLKTLPGLSAGSAPNPSMGPRSPRAADSSRPLPLRPRVMLPLPAPRRRPSDPSRPSDRRRRSTPRRPASPAGPRLALPSSPPPSRCRVVHAGVAADGFADLALHPAPPVGRRRPVAPDSSPARRPRGLALRPAALVGAERSAEMDAPETVAA